VATQNRHLFTDIRLVLQDARLRPVYTIAATTGGVASESMPFPPEGATVPPFHHRLRQAPVSSIVSVAGRQGGESRQFEIGTDVVLLGDRQTLAWREEGEAPDQGTTVTIRYIPFAAEQPRTPTDRSRVLDLRTAQGRENLAQAVVMRLLTPRGELAELAHPEYGSRLTELIGRRNTEITRNLARLFILESLQLEPRIEEVVEVTVEPDRFVRDLVRIRLRVRPIGETDILTIGPFTLELAP
jgi:phage baseplate assembly protein W